MTDPLPLRLLSDFHEPYDHHFASRHREDLPVWRRWSRTARTRSDDHRLLLAAGLSVPQVGRLETFGPGRLVVAHVDPHAHRGDGKQRGTVEQLTSASVPSRTYCTAWVGPLAGGVTTRCLGAGRLFWWLTYETEAAGEWRSNVEAKVSLCPSYPTEEPHKIQEAVYRLQRMLREPLVAVDLVSTDTGELYAIDLATAPGIPLDVLTEFRDEAARDIADSIASRWAEVHA